MLPTDPHFLQMYPPKCTNLDIPCPMVGICERSFIETAIGSIVLMLNFIIVMVNWWIDFNHHITRKIAPTTAATQTTQHTIKTAGEMILTLGAFGYGVLFTFCK